MDNVIIKNDFLVRKDVILLINCIESIYRDVLKEQKNKKEIYFFTINMKSSEQHYIFFDNRKTAEEYRDKLLIILLEKRKV